MTKLDNFKTIPVQTAHDEPSPKRAKRADAVANRQLILETAHRLFSDRGLETVCMATIAEAAGIGKGTLYRAFANKGELCLALMDEDMRRFQNDTLQMFRALADQPALSRLDTFLDRLAHFMDRHAPLLCEAQRQGILRRVPQTPGTSLPMWLPWLRETIALLLQQAEQTDEADGLDIPYLAEAILAPLNPDLFMYQREILGFEIERISRGVRRLVMNGCRA